VAREDGKGLAAGEENADANEEENEHAKSEGALILVLRSGCPEFPWRLANNNVGSEFLGVRRGGPGKAKPFC
jgi:hypothetical protein